MSMGSWVKTVQGAVTFLGSEEQRVRRSAAALLASFPLAIAGSFVAHPSGLRVESGCGGPRGGGSVEPTLALAQQLRLQSERARQRERELEDAAFSVQEGLVGALADLSRQHTDVQRSLARKETQVAQLLRQVEALEEDLEEKERMQEEEQERNKELQTRNEELEEDLRDTSAQLQTWKDAAETAQDKNQELEERVLEREERVAELEHKLAALAGKHQEQAAVIAKQTEQLRASKSVQSAIQKLCGSLVIETPKKGHAPAS